MQQPLVSVIVPTKNSERTLNECLLSIKNQTYKNIELIVVDNNSTDNTKEIARKFTDKVFNKGPERSVQKNFAAKKAHGKYLLFVDADMELTSDVVFECTELAEVQPEIKAVIIPEESFGQGFWAQCKALERSTYIGDDSIEAARFFERKTFFKVGGFDEGLFGGEDWNLTDRLRRVSYQIGRVKSFIRHHEGKLSFWRTVTKKYYYSAQIRKNLAKKPAHLLSRASPIRPAYLRHWRRLVSDPLHTAGFLFLWFSELAAGLIGFLVSFLRK